MEAVGGEFYEQLILLTVLAYLGLCTSEALATIEQLWRHGRWSGGITAGRKKIKRS